MRLTPPTFAGSLPTAQKQAPSAQPTHFTARNALTSDVASFGVSQSTLHFAGKTREDEKDANRATARRDAKKRNTAATEVMYLKGAAQTLEAQKAELAEKLEKLKMEVAALKAQAGQAGTAENSSS